MEQKKEDIIKELIFETTTRELLVGKSSYVSQTLKSGEAVLQNIGRTTDLKNANSTSTRYPTKAMWFFSRIAALVIVVLGAIFLFKNQVQDTSTKDQYATSIYSLPTVSKSRGAVPNIIDQYIDILDDIQYSAVLTKLNSATSEKDLWIKAHLLYNLGKYSEFTQLVESHEWQDEFYATDIDWLRALVLYRDGSDIIEIERLYPELNSEQLILLNGGY